MPPEPPAGLPIRPIVIPAPAEPGRPGAEHRRPFSTPRLPTLAGVLASAVLSASTSRGGAGCAARLRRPRALVARARREPDVRGRAARRLGDGGRLRRRRYSPGSASRSAATRGSARRPGCRVLLVPRRCSSRSSWRSRWCATSPAGATARIAARAGGRIGLGGDRVARAQAARRHDRPRALSVAAPAPGRRPRRHGGPHFPADAGQRRHRGGAGAPDRRRRARWPGRWRSRRSVPVLMGATASPRSPAAAMRRAPASRCASALVQSNIVRLRASAPGEGRLRGGPQRARHPLRDVARGDRAAARGRGAVVGDGVPDHLRPPQERGRRRTRPRDPRLRQRGRRAASCSAPTTATRQASTTRPLSSRPAPACSGLYRKTRLFLLTEHVPGVARRTATAALAAVDRQLEGRHGARVFPLRTRRRPRDSGVADDLPGRRRHPPGHRRRAARRAGHPDDVERLLVHRSPASARNCTRWWPPSAASRRACRSCA